MNFDKLYRIILLILVSMSASSQGVFKLSGEVQNPTERRVLITLYRDWVGDEEEYEIPLDKDNRFVFEANLSTDIAYIDFYYAEEGFHYWIIQPKDQIELKIDNKDFWKSLNVSGNGSTKWNYYLKQKKEFEDSRDFVKELISWRKLTKSAFFRKIDGEQNEQLYFLEHFKDLDANFVEVRKADIVGWLQNYKVEYLSTDEFKEQSETQTRNELIIPKLSDESKAKSLEFGNMQVNLLDLFVAKASEKKKKDPIVSDYYNTLKAMHLQGDLPRELTERLMAFKLKIHADFPEEEGIAYALMQDFDAFAQNRDFKNYINKRSSLLKNLAKGSVAKSFTAKDINGKEVSLKDFKGKVVYIDFWASWCGPCIYDIRQMVKVKERFRNNKNVIFIYVSLDKENEWREAVFENNVEGINLRVDENSSFARNYGVRAVPTYFLIDKNGYFAVSRVADPSEEDGEALIKQIEEVLQKK
ncbi:MAG: TlpA family protein disulfide reductase [Spirosomaceae bacterium]|nr:TlpA family protein disulfide reductase [Spirosomataceae bacterium]